MIPNDSPLLGSAYPKMLYREAKGEPMFELRGDDHAVIRGLDHRIVHDEDEELAHLDDGWSAELDAKPAKGKAAA